MDWFKIDYLLEGNQVQKAAYHALQRLGIFEDLAAYSPVLVGTIPIDVNIAGSDLDILLCAPDLPELAERLAKLYPIKAAHYGEQEGKRYYLAKLNAEGFEIEFFAQDITTHLQNGYRHMLIEARLLELAGDEAREVIRKLKRSGLKTEPAFAQYFKLAGNPYEVLIGLLNYSQEDLELLIK
jgi:hypothetical protein